MKKSQTKQKNKKGRYASKMLEALSRNKIVDANKKKTLTKNLEAYNICHKKKKRVRDEKIRNKGEKKVEKKASKKEKNKHNQFTFETTTTKKITIRRTQM